MKKIFITLLTLITLSSCDTSKKIETVKELPTEVEKIEGIKVTRLTDQLDQGLNHVIINDTLEILIYRGVESVSMIRIK
jgi:hypothetical protein